MGTSLLWLLAGAPAVLAQFGSPGFNQPPPICPAFTCKAKQKAVAKADAKVWAYGCKDSGMNFLNMASFDANDPLGGLGGMKDKKSVDKCCVGKEICMRTCGMPSKTCYENFQKCSKQICKGDSNCEMMAQFSDILSVPHDTDRKKQLSEHERRCLPYTEAQQEFCECVPKGEWQGAVEGRLKSFYRSFKPEKLDADGDIKDIGSIWKQWKGKEPEMFMALTTKYKDKAVQIRQKPTPTPKPYTDITDPDQHDAASPGMGQDDAPEPAGAGVEQAEEDDGGFAAKLRDLEERKTKAKDAEDYDLAQELKDEAAKLKREEVKRLTSTKDAFVAAEDYLQAKRLKAQISKLEL